MDAKVGFFVSTFVTVPSALCSITVSPTFKRNGAFWSDVLTRILLVPASDTLRLRPLCKVMPGMLFPPSCNVYPSILASLLTASLELPLPFGAIRFRTVLRSCPWIKSGYTWRTTTFATVLLLSTPFCCAICACSIPFCFGCAAMKTLRVKSVSSVLLIVSLMPCPRTRTSPIANTPTKSAVSVVVVRKCCRPMLRYASITGVFQERGVNMTTPSTIVAKKNTSEPPNKTSPNPPKTAKAYTPNVLLPRCEA